MARQSRWTQQDEETGEEAGSPCSRGAWCAGRKIITENGERVIIPARTYSAFCPACRDLIGRCLTELPAAYGRLAQEIGEPVRRNSSVRTPLGPSLPLRADVDDVMRSICEILQSWEERVRDIARLSVIDTEASRRRDMAAAVARAVITLSPRLDVLFALEDGPMVRAVPVPGHKGEPEQITLADLDGRDAGEEILRLHRRAQLILGEAASRPETLDGVPCKRCEAMSLERAEPPSDPSREAMWSQCCVLSCRHQMTRRDFDAWSAWYAKWASSSGIDCRRCQQDRHGECQWKACACASAGHSAAA